MRGVPPRSLWSSRRQPHWRDPDGLAVVLAGAAAGYGGDRSGRSPAVPCAAADAPGGLPPKGRVEKLPPRNGEIPRLNPGRLRRVTLAAHFLSIARVRPCCSRPGPSGSARRRCALEAVKKVVTAPGLPGLPARIRLRLIVGTAAGWRSAPSVAWAASRRPRVTEAGSTRRTVCAAMGTYRNSPVVTAAGTQ
jgi:hypothetical protein